MNPHIGTDPGYFGERLGAARNQLVRTWKARSARLESNFSRTDITGALLLSSQILNGESTTGQKLLIIFSDMRQDTPEFDIETAARVPPYSAVPGKCGPHPDLRGVRVVVVGAGGAGHPTSYWHDLQVFWSEYFHSVGAELEKYSALREMISIP